MCPYTPEPSTEIRTSLGVVDERFNEDGCASISGKEGGGVCASEGVGRMVEHSLSEEAAVNVQQG